MYCPRQQAVLRFGTRDPLVRARRRLPILGLACRRSRTGILTPIYLARATQAHHMPARDSASFHPAMLPDHRQQAAHRRALDARGSSGFRSSRSAGKCACSRARWHLLQYWAIAADREPQPSPRVGPLLFISASASVLTPGRCRVYRGIAPAVPFRSTGLACRAPSAQIVIQNAMFRPSCAP